jgi:hypothetical protein
MGLDTKLVGKIRIALIGKGVIGSYIYSLYHPMDVVNRGEKLDDGYDLYILTIPSTSLSDYTWIKGRVLTTIKGYAGIKVTDLPSNDIGVIGGYYTPVSNRGWLFGNLGNNYTSFLNVKREWMSREQVEQVVEANILKNMYLYSLPYTTINNIINDIHSLPFLTKVRMALEEDVTFSVLNKSRNYLGGQALVKDREKFERLRNTRFISTEGLVSFQHHFPTHSSLISLMEEREW